MLPRYFPEMAKREAAFAIPFASPVLPLLTRLLDIKLVVHMSCTKIYVRCLELPCNLYRPSPASLFRFEKNDRWYCDTVTFPSTSPTK